MKESANDIADMAQQAASTSSGASMLTLLIASEVRFVRESLGEILGRGGAISVVGYSADHGQTLTLSQSLRPDMVLLDASVQDGPDAVRRLRDAHADLRIVVFALSESVDSVLPWAQAGVAGYIPNTAATDDLRSLIAEISMGRQPCSPLVAAGLLRQVAAGGTIATRVDPIAPMLTPRELEIVRLITAGLSNKEIARRLNIGLATTKSHVHNLLGKLKVQRRGQIATWMHTGSPPS